MSTLWRRLNARRDHRWAQSRLSAYVEGDMRRASHSRLHGHESICPECRRAIETLRTMLAALPGLRGREPRREAVADRAARAVRERIDAEEPSAGPT